MCLILVGRCICSIKMLENAGGAVVRRYMIYVVACSFDILLNYSLTLSPYSFLVGNQSPAGGQAPATAMLPTLAPLSMRCNRGEYKSLVRWVDILILMLKLNPKVSLTITTHLRLDAAPTSSRNKPHTQVHWQTLYRFVWDATGACIECTGVDEGPGMVLVWRGRWHTVLQSPVIRFLSGFGWAQWHQQTTQQYT